MTDRIAIDRLTHFVYELLVAIGLNAANARIVTDVFVRATLRGVGHHDIYFLPEWLGRFNDKLVNLTPNITLLQKTQPVESYEGDNGPGELCSSHIMQRAIDLAHQYGIGLCTIRHSNHFLAAAPYVEQAAEQNYLGLIFSRCPPAVMGAPGARHNFIGNNPLGFAAQTGHDFPLMLDIAMAYASLGKLEENIALGKSVPDYWGTNAAGRPTTDPKAILEGGMSAPIGGHKGFGLALLTEILTGVLSGGEILDEPNATNDTTGVYAQTAIEIKVEGLLPVNTFRQRTSDLINRSQA